MKSRLLIRLTEIPPRQFQWLSIDADKPSVESGTCDQGSAHKLPQPTHLTLVFPTRQVLFSRFQLPTRNLQQIEMAIPSLIEEKLINDVDDMHIVFQQVDEGRVEVAAIEKSMVDGLITRLAECGLKADFAMPDCFLLPYTPRGWTIYESDEGLLIRSGLFSGFFYDRDWLEQLGHEHLFDITEDKPEKLHVYHHAETPQYDYHGVVSPENLELDRLDAEEGLLELALQTDIASDTANFLSGEFAPEQSSRRNWLNWRLPVYAVAASLVLITVMLFIQNITYDHRLEASQAHVDSTFRSIFPDVEPIANMGDEAYRLQFQREVEKRLHQGQQNHPALISLHNVLSHVKKYPGVSVQSLSYKGGTYTIDIRSANASAVGRIVRAVNNVRGLQAMSLASPTGADSKLSRIQVVARGGA